MSAGNRNRLSFKEEVSWGVDPAGNYQIIRKIGDAGITLDRAQIATEEWNSRRAVTGFRLGNKSVGVNLPFELSYLTYDTPMESAFYSSWVAATAAHAGAAVTVNSSAKTMAATGIDTGISAGDWIKTTGFADAGNNGFFKVTTVASGLLTLASAVGLVNVTSDADVIVQKMGYLIPGTTAKSLAFCEGQLDINAYVQALGCRADAFSLSVQPDAIIKGAFTFLGKTFNGPQGTTYGGTEVAENTNDVFQSNDAYSNLWFDNAATPTCAVTAFDFALANGGNRVMPVFCNTPNAITAGDAVFTGNLTMLREDYTMLTKYLAETTLALTSRMMNPAGTAGYAFEFPKAKLTAHNLQRAKDNDLITLPWSALEDSPTTYNACKIWRLA